MEATGFHIPTGAILFSEGGALYDFPKHLGEAAHGLSLLLAYERTAGGNVKLADFGLALSTLPGCVVSTVRRSRGAYSPLPEMRMGFKPDARSDLFSPGLVLLKMATGRNLLESRRVHQTRSKRPPPAALFLAQNSAWMGGDGSISSRTAHFRTAGEYHAARAAVGF
ncbi:hypothetical protein F0U62_13260 [Cystobacter fuscus]|uniref:hypothetical protein n=1 Tax=Cystobacter fuscus TaxID=43 RepID=UPI002B2DCF5F|nr:hypothetical protein F0U62_13260 [Cystobacter fuscus]